MYHCLRFHLHGQSVSAAVAASSALSARSTAAPAAAASLCARSECDVVSAAAAVACRLSRAWPPCRRHHARSCDGLDHRKAAPRHRQALNEEECTAGPSRTGHRERNWPGSRPPRAALLHLPSDCYEADPAVSPAQLWLRRAPPRVPRATDSSGMRLRTGLGPAPGGSLKRLGRSLSVARLRG